MCEVPDGWNYAVAKVLVEPVAHPMEVMELPRTTSNLFQSPEYRAVAKVKQSRDLASHRFHCKDCNESLPHSRRFHELNQSFKHAKEVAANRAQDKEAFLRDFNKDAFLREFAQFECKDCDLPFWRFEELKQHKKCQAHADTVAAERANQASAEKGEHACPFCHKFWPADRLRNLKRHNNSVHAGRVAKGDAPDMVVKRKLRHTNTEHYCILCHKGFKNDKDHERHKQTAKIHLDRVAGIRAPALDPDDRYCDVCDGKEFADANKLVEHRKSKTHQKKLNEKNAAEKAPAKGA